MKAIFEIERLDNRRISLIWLIPRPNTEQEQAAFLPSLFSALILAGQTATTLEVGTQSLLGCI